MKVNITNNGVINVFCNSCTTPPPKQKQTPPFQPMSPSLSSNQSQQKRLPEIAENTGLFDVPSFVPKDDFYKMKDFVETLDQFSKQSFSSLNAKTLQDVLPITNSEIEVLKRWSKKTDYKILYSASRDGLSRKSIVAKCQGHKNTFFLVQFDDENVVALFFGDALPKPPAAGPSFLDAKNHFLAVLKHPKTQPFRLKCLNWNEKTYVVGAIDEYVDRVFSCKSCLLLKRDYYYIFSDLSLYTCVDEKIDFKKFFKSGGIFRELVCVEMI
ncbi:hypothetical protein EIN_087460 [Entamoeba invadens IP1]|uniref:hypothetical protein n=1 Tax=Entamoeba invadens IP1 TaxID=370355 RepID=UPI0002C3D921|nr:hypothetical protein EIN_087460 [Entamoeba invadens IP1]ELP85434.1 hypothetical protein EIN_087460 [Entamoeba invadens IP1]|eukprot:XP_004184780.1 hypothetical protein EIN_087460 [Entamoeba invadens IP1]